MANVDRPFGLQPIKHLNGSSWNGQTERCYVHASYATALFPGDVVDLQTETDHQDPTAKHMSVMAATLADGNYAIGVIVSIEPDPDNLTRSYLPASTGGYVNVCISPDVVYLVQDNGAATPTKLFPGQNAILVQDQAGDTTYGLSGLELDANADAPEANASNMIFILRAHQREDNELGTRTVWEVLLNMHRLKATGDGDGSLGVTAS